MVTPPLGGVSWISRGRIDGSGRLGDTAVVTATAPLAELFGYATRLRSLTKGRGTFTARTTGYAPTGKLG